MEGALLIGALLMSALRIAARPGRVFRAVRIAN